jgi:hypothetical protein
MQITLESSVIFLTFKIETPLNPPQSSLRPEAAPPRKGQRDFTSDFNKIRCSTSAALLKRFTPEIAFTFHCISMITILPEFQALEKAGRKNLWVAK